MSSELEKWQSLHAELEYYLKSFQVLLAVKKEFALQQRIEEKIIGLIKTISPEPTVESAPTTELRQG